MIQRILLAAPRGPCAGVNRAIDIIERVLEKYETPIYVNHELVHNTFVVRDLTKRGVILSRNFENIPQGAVYLFSAHGVSPQFRKKAEQRNLKLIDATCPLVIKVHEEAKRFVDNGYHLFYIGHKGHPEVEGVMGVTDMHLIEKLEDVENVNFEGENSNSRLQKMEKMVVLTQTTLSFQDTEEILKALQKKFPHIEMPPGKDICYATTNRQQAVQELAKKSDFVVVVGSKNSSNSNRLVEAAQKAGCEAMLVDDFFEIPEEIWNAEILGITSGASVPEKIVEELLEKAKIRFPDIKVEQLEILKERMKFVLPEI